MTEEKIYIVYFYMKGKPKQYITFTRYIDAINCLKNLHFDENCECCGFVR